MTNAMKIDDLTVDYLRDKYLHHPNVKDASVVQLCDAYRSLRIRLESAENVIRALSVPFFEPHYHCPKKRMKHCVNLPPTERNIPMTQPKEPETMEQRIEEMRRLDDFATHHFLDPMDHVHAQREAEDHANELTRPLALAYESLRAENAKLQKRIDNMEVCGKMIAEELKHTGHAFNEECGCAYCGIQNEVNDMALPESSELEKLREIAISAIKGALEVGEIKFKTCVLSSDIHDRLVNALAALEKK